MQIRYKGATPIEKNVIVIDEQGNKYEATYPKRAKGLVKNGRARFVDENTICLCLACPPNEILEDNEMSENIEKIENTNVAENEKAKAAVTETAKNAAENACEKYSIAYALDMIERIAVDTEHIHQAIATIGSMKNEGTPCGGSAQALAKAAADVVCYRETTSQKLIAFYEGMINDLKKTKAVSADEAKMRQQFLDFVHSTTVGADAGSILPDFANIWKTVFLGQ